MNREILLYGGGFCGVVGSRGFVPLKRQIHSPRVGVFGVVKWKKRVHRSVSDVDVDAAAQVGEEVVHGVDNVVGAEVGVDVRHRKAYAKRVDIGAANAA